MKPGVQPDLEELWLQKAGEIFVKINELMVKGLNTQSKRYDVQQNKAVYTNPDVQNLNQHFLRFRQEPSRENNTSFSTALNNCQSSQRVFNFNYQEINSLLTNFQEAETNRAKAAEAKKTANRPKR